MIDWSCFAKIRTGGALKKYVDRVFDGDTDRFLREAFAASDDALSNDFALARRLADRLYRLQSGIDDPLCRSLITRNTGKVYHLTGEHKKARTYYRRAEKGLRSLRNYAELSKVWKSLVDVMMYLGRYDEALEYGTRAIRYYRRHNDPIQEAQTLNNIGNVYHRRDECSKALRCYERASAVFLEAKRSLFWAKSEYNRANILANLNELGEAARIYDDVARIHENSGNRLSLANCVYSCGYTHFLAGEYQLAISEIERAADLFTELNDQRSVGLCHLDLGQVFLELNLLAEAKQNAGLAIRIFSKARIDYELAKAELTLAESLLNEGRCEEANRHITTARKTFRKEANRFYESYCNLIRGRIARELREPVRALEFFREAYEFYRRSGSERMEAISYLYLLETKIENQSSSLSPAENRKLNRYHSFKGSPSIAIASLYMSARLAARKSLYPEAIRFLNRAEEVIDQNRLALDVEEFKLGYVSDKQRIYELLSKLLISQSNNIPEGLRMLEKSKMATVFDMRNAWTMERTGSGTSPENREEIDDVRQKLFGLYNRLRCPKDEDSPSRALSGGRLATEVRDTELRLRKLIRKTAVKRPLQCYRPSDWHASLSRIQSGLKEGNLILEFFLTADAVYWFLISRDNLKIKTAQIDYRRIELLVSKFYFQIGKFVYLKQCRASGPSVLGKTISRILKDMGDLLIAPIKEWIAGSDLTIIPHRITHRIPFAALMHYDPDLAGTRVNLLPSLRMLFWTCRNADLRARRKSFFGIPDGNLRFVDKEREAVVDAFPDTDVYYGESATRQAFLDALERPHSLVHLAGHALMREDNPAFSAFRFSDGWLNQYDLSGRNICVDLFVLSSCLSGPQEVAPGDELLGLHRGLLQAGVNSIIASLWPVDDEATGRLMLGFYSRLKQRYDVRQSYHTAIAEQITRYDHPFYWSSFTLMSRMP